MSNITDLIDRYFDAWNETDAERRRVLIARTWTETATYVDPMLESQGHDGIDGMIRAVQERFPGHRFKRNGEVEAHHGRLRFCWDLAPDGGPAVAEGTDFAVLASDRLQSVTGFFDRVPASL